MSPGRGDEQEGVGHEQSDLNASTEREDDETSSGPKNNEMDTIPRDG